MARAGIVPDAQLAATFMKVYCSAMEVHVAEMIFRTKLKKWNIQPNRYHYNALLVAHAKQGDLGSVKILLRCTLSHSTTLLLSKIIKAA